MTSAFPLDPNWCLGKIFNAAPVDKPCPVGVRVAHHYASPFSYDLLRHCYMRAVSTEQPYMRAKGQILYMNGHESRLEDRLVLFRSGQVGGLLHDADVSPEPGAVFVPAIGRVSWESVVGSQAMLDEATSLACGRDLVLVCGVLPNGHSAVVLDFAAGADAENVGVRARYKQVLRDLFEWQHLLLRGKVVTLADGLRAILSDRLKEDPKVPVAAPAPPPKGQGVPEYDEVVKDRKTLVREYWAYDEAVLIRAQQAALSHRGWGIAKRLLAKVDETDDKAVLAQLVKFVNTKGPLSVLPLAERQLMVRRHTHWPVTLHIIQTFAQGCNANGRLSEGTARLIELVRAEDPTQNALLLPHDRLQQRAAAEHADWAALCSPRARWEIVKDLWQQALPDMVESVRVALDGFEAELAMDPLNRVRASMSRQGFVYAPLAPDHRLLAYDTARTLWSDEADADDELTRAMSRMSLPWVYEGEEQAQPPAEDDEDVEEEFFSPGAQSLGYHSLNEDGWWGTTTPAPPRDPSNFW